MSLDEIVAAMEDHADKLKDLNHTILFDLGDGRSRLVGRYRGYGEDCR